MATEATTGTTLTPASSHMGIYFEGFPAPVVTTATRSFAASSATSAAKGDISMMFTPKGLSVRDRARSICSLRYCALAFMAEIIPSPPPLETAAASLPSDIQAMPPWKMGYSIPKSSHNGVLIIDLYSSRKRIYHFITQAALESPPPKAAITT